MPDLKIEVGEAQIQNAIAVALADSFSEEKRKGLIRDVVRAHLNVKESSYDKETLFSKTVGKMVRSCAEEAIEKKLDSLKPEIEKTVSEYLGDKFKTNIFERLKRALSQKTVSEFHISASFDEDV